MSKALLVGLFLAVAPVAVSAQTHPALSRLDVGVAASGVAVEDSLGRSSYFAPRVWASYSLTSQLSLAASYEANGQSLENGEIRVGGRMALTGNKANDRIQVGLGANAIRYDEDNSSQLKDHPWSWTGGVYTSYGVVRNKDGKNVVFAQAQAEHDVENKLTFYRLGLSATLF